METHFDRMRGVKLLADWVAFSQKHLYICPERRELICYGAGEHGHWGVHTHQKAFSAFAVAAAMEEIDWQSRNLTREKVLEQALGMLRYTLATHVTGDFVCTDGQQWGHNWIYVLGVERMFHGIEAIEPFLTQEDRDGLRKMVLSECDFLLREYLIEAGLVQHNKPESNIWNGAMLYRGAALYPDAANCAAYRKKAQEFFANGISIEADENSDEVVDGRRIGDMFVGANMFNSYATNHHGYMNVGYMVICLSNIAMLHFFLKGRGVQADDILYHHAYEQWRLIRTCTFEDGRLLRIGGDSRARYCYCQDYALPMWALVEDKYGEDCSALEKGWLSILEKETAVNGDGSFLSNRFGHFEEQSPVYYTRLESDRANALSMMLYWHDRYPLSAQKTTPTHVTWHDAYHGASFDAHGHRYASFVWRASEKPQALFLPKSDSSLAEWRYNLCGRIEGVGRANFDEVHCHQEKFFEGGFLTCGSTIVYSDQFMAEGQLKETMAQKHVAFAALPDGASAICLQYARALNRTFVATLRGVLWNVPNDIFNGRQRLLAHENGADYLRGGDYAKRYEQIDAGHWVNVDGKIGLASPQKLTIVRPGRRQVEILGRENSGTLYAEEICAPYSTKRRFYDRNETLIDVGFGMTLGDACATRALSDSLATNRKGDLFAITATGQDGRRYTMLANFGENAMEIDLDAWKLGAVGPYGEKAAHRKFALSNDEAVLIF